MVSDCKGNSTKSHKKANLKLEARSTHRYLLSFKKVSATICLIITIIIAGLLKNCTRCRSLILTFEMILDQQSCNNLA